MKNLNNKNIEEEIFLENLKNKKINPFVYYKRKKTITEKIFFIIIGALILFIILNIIF